jgi:hypothetical protein
MDPPEEAAVAEVVQRAVARIPEKSDAVVKGVSGTTKQPAEFRKPPLGCSDEEHYKEIEEPKDIVGGGPYIYIPNGGYQYDLILQLHVRV